jgi:hypothetical protein
MTTDQNQDKKMGENDQQKQNWNTKDKQNMQGGRDMQNKSDSSTGTKDSSPEESTGSDSR